MTRILLVEDNEMNSDMLSRRLKKKGYEVTLAVNGADAVQMNDSDRPDLILMDMSLPVMSGEEATRAIRSRESSTRVPILALTASALSGDRDLALACGCDDYDTKPVELSRLLEKIEGLLANRK